MSKNKSKKHGNVSPEEEFLATLGIKPVSLEAGWKELCSLLKKKGIKATLESLYKMEPRTGEPNPMIYASKEIATLVASLCHSRLLQNLKGFKLFKGLPKNPKKIVELGSAAGIFSIYLAKIYPNCQVIAYDWTEEPLEVGRQWAADLGLKNITFTKASYEEISNLPPSHDCDLVFLYYGLFLPDWPPTSATYFLIKDALKTVSPNYSKDVDFAAKSFSNLLMPSGIGIINCYWDEWGVVSVMNALDKTDMHIRWDLNVGEFTPEPDGNSSWYSYLFIGKEYPDIKLSVCEKARAFMVSVEHKGSVMEPNEFILESISTLFEVGTCFLHLEVELQSHELERIRLICHGGLLLFEHTRAPVIRKGLIVSFSAIGGLIDLIHKQIVFWKQNNATLLIWDAEPSFEKLLSYYGLERPDQPSNLPDKAA